ncbi:PAS domain-containing sensor histidine kinase [Methylobacterium phyllosphaerae]
MSGSASTKAKSERPRGRGFDAAHLHAILESATDYAFIAMCEHRRITGWSPGAETLMGWTEDEILGQPADLIFIPEDRAAGTPDAEEQNARAKGRARDERWHLRKNGSRFWAVGELIQLRTEPGGFVKIFRDQTERMQGEERLRESEDHLKHTVELNPQVPWTCDPHGNITSYSQRWLDLTGQAPGEPDGTGWLKVLHPDDLEPTLTVFSACLASGEPVDVDYRIRVASEGEYRWMRARAYPRLNEADAIIRWYGVVEDVHDRKLAEQELVASEAKLAREREVLAAIIRQAPVGISISEAPSGRSLILNDKAVEITGHRELGGSIARYAAYGARHPDGRPYTVEDYPSVRALLRGETVINEEIVYCHGGRDGSGPCRRVSFNSAPVRNDAGEIIAAVTLIEDVEQERLRQEALQRSEALNRAITEHAPDALFLLNAEGQITVANPAASRLLGWKPSELIGRVLHDIAHHHLADGRPYPAHECPLSRAHACGLVLEGHETTFFRKDGSPVEVQCSAAPILADGHVIGSVQVAHDITERRKAEEQQRLLVNELNHRVKNTLATVQAMTAQSVRNAATPEDVRQALEPRLLTLARAHDILTRETWEGANLQDIVASAVDLHQSSGPTRFNTQGPPVRLEPRIALALTLALHELATNAVKYGALSNETGCVEITWKVEEASDGPHLSLEWSESGGPGVVPPKRKGFGSRLIERSLAGEFGAEVHLAYEPAGVRCTVVVPLDDSGQRTPRSLPSCGELERA